MKRRVISFLSAVAIIALGVAAITVYMVEIYLLIPANDVSVGLYLFGGGIALTGVVFYFISKYATPKIEKAFD